ncbi:MAG: anaerobic glycerol-3-phosphate dehydrogenase subunit C [Pirellulales bacterium]|nr:anaerobic glycerol-3-phosphate dehydrogenase subunit C [Pirellulales bacterium]
MEQLDQHRERIQDDLRGLISGEIRCDEIFRQLYASDGSIYEIRPLGVVRPRSASDVQSTVEYAAEKKIPLHARGAGTGVAGQSLGTGLVIDFARHMHRVIRVGEATVRVQPGVVEERLNVQLAASSRVFGPDPANSRATTIGSVLAIDGAGIHWLKYGSAARHVLEMSVILPSGHRIKAAREPLFDGESKDPDPIKRELVNRLAKLLENNRDLIRNSRVNSPVNCCGYRLEGVLGQDESGKTYLDLVRLLVGSEGTLALTTEATLATQPLPAFRGVALFLFEGLETAARAVGNLLPHNPASCDLLDRRFLSLAREIEPRFNELIPKQTEAVLIVEQHADSQTGIRERLKELVGAIAKTKTTSSENTSTNGPFGVRLAFDPMDVDLYCQLSLKALPALGRLEGASRPVPVIEDIAVAPARLAVFLVASQNILKRHEITAALSCHAGQGQIHLQPFLDLGDPQHIDKMRCLANELYEEVFRVGGTISGEHGVGLSRSPFVERQNTELYDVFRQVKHIFDPDNLFNPGKIVGSEPKRLTDNLRPVIQIEDEQNKGGQDQLESESTPRLRDLIELQLNWNPKRLARTARRCTSCGDCRTHARDARMCPMFRIRLTEESSPRAKANLARALLTKRIELENLTSDELKDVVDLCYNCHMCVLDCPAHVDIPRMVAECKAAHATAKGLPPVDHAMMRLDMIGNMAGSFPRIANWALTNGQMRWLLEQTLGIAQGRKVPRVSSPSFLRRAAKRRLTQPRRQRELKVAYFVDTYANFFDPGLAEALVAILKHNGVAVFVPPEQMQAGTSAISVGALDRARRLARHNTTVLADAVRQGYQVITTEPAAALTLTHEYPYLLDNDDTRLVSKNTTDAGAFLWKMHTKGKLQLDFKPMLATIGYHLPCRLRAMQVGSPAENLLRMIPGLSVSSISQGCCGMAGDYGIKRNNYRTSLRIGWRIVSAMRTLRLQAGATECSACKMQMEQGTTKPTAHPIKILAAAYGLIPGGEDLLTTPGEGRVTTV